MTHRRIRVFTLVACLLALCRSASADDSLFEPRSGELRLGPQIQTANLEGVVIGARVAALLQVRRDGSTREVRARIVADLSDLDAKIGQLVSRLPLPKDNCARRGSLENLIVSVERSDLSVSGNRAIVELRGELEVWACVDIPFSSPAKTRLKTESFTATIPIRLVASPLSIALAFDRPGLELNGPWGSVIGAVLKLAGVDVTSELDRLLRRALRPEDLRAMIPAALLRLDPQILDARFFDHAGSLAAEIEGTVNLQALVLQDLSR